MKELLVKVWLRHCELWKRVELGRSTTFEGDTLPRGREEENIIIVITRLMIGSK